jgi:alanine dehydrogenase
VIIGIPKEMKDQEKRVALLPEAVAVLAASGHRVLVQKGAGTGSGYADAEYRSAGATMVPRAELLYKTSEMVVKVKEPLRAEYRFFRPNLKIFCYLHLAANRSLTRALLKSGAVALGFETLEDAQGGTPLLKPMSEIAGRLAVMLGGHYLQKNHGGRGVLLSPTHFSPPGKVTVVGAGSVGRAAAELAAGLGAEVVVLDIRAVELEPWARDFSNIRLLLSEKNSLSAHLRDSDLVVGAVYVHGARTPKVISREMVRGMPKGSVLVDVAVDQGGAAETTRPTSISRPIYLRYGVVHCAVTNLPALVSRTASQALSRAILPYVQKVAEKTSWEELTRDSLLTSAVNVAAGKIIHSKVKASLSL